MLIFSIEAETISIRIFYFKKTPDPKKPPSSIKRSNTTLSRPTYQRAQSPTPDFKPPHQQNMRFFGDTDLESLSKSATTPRKRTPLHANNSQSLQNLRGNRNPPRRVDSDSSQNVRSAASMQSLNKVSFLRPNFLLFLSSRNQLQYI